ncbi:MAG: ABC transporter permease [Selenomonadaceae bacterium]|nr:ABC transporter permease [Selenomonadaceae bacterium]
MPYSTNIIKEIPLVIFDAENTKLSREIVAGFYDSENFKIVAQVDSEEKMLECLKEKRAFVALEIPPDFSKKIVQEGAASVLCEINGANIAITNVASSTAQDILNSVSEKFSKHCAALSLGIAEDTAAKKISPVTTTLRILGICANIFCAGKFFGIVAAFFINKNNNFGRQLFIGDNCIQ